jgi:nucleotide-binding universal stress UspA family protein
MKNILLLIHDDAGQEARLQCALDVVRAVDGHLHCLDVSLLPPLPDCSFDGAADALLMTDERTREDANKAAIERRLGHEDVRWSWADATGDFAGCIDDAAALADLIVLNRKLDSFPYPDMRATTGAILLKSGKPILAAPDDARRFAVTGRALVAWDGSPCAAAAMRAAVPLLSLANEVTLLEIDDGSIQTPAEEAAEYLSRHDVHARIVRDFALSQPPAKVLLVGIEVQRADYVVMGAYGHFRATEAVFGGVTRCMLSESPVPVLLAH